MFGRWERPFEATLAWVCDCVSYPGHYGVRMAGGHQLDLCTVCYLDLRNKSAGNVFETMGKENVAQPGM